MLNRRRFLAYSAAAATASLVRSIFCNAEVPQAFTPWTSGTLDIHHIATNRGNSTLMIQPDGTTLLVDAGALYAHTPYLVSTLPSEERRPGEWIGRYIQRHLSAAGLPNRIDAFMLTHHHDDHMRAVLPSAVKNAKGYILTGVSDVDTIVTSPIRGSRSFIQLSHGPGRRFCSGAGGELPSVSQEQGYSG